jgi:hypothetical protein
MTHIGTDMSPAQRVAKIDLTKVMQHVAEDTGLPAATLARAEEMYRQFLTLKAMNKAQMLVPPKLVDLVWHAHITFTRQYMSDCDMMFGEYLHHEAATSEDEEAAYSSLYDSVTVASYRREFGVDLYRSGLAPEMVRAAGCGGL